jgi:hypothetical protein
MSIEPEFSSFVGMNRRLHDNVRCRIYRATIVTRFSNPMVPVACGADLSMCLSHLHTPAIYPELHRDARPHRYQTLIHKEHSCLARKNDSILGGAVVTHTDQGIARVVDLVMTIFPVTKTRPT